MNSRVLLLVGFSNILEWLDFGLLIYLAPIIGSHFFPTTTASNADIEVYAAFAIGFICRPLGGIVFGHIGDRGGRSKALRVSVFGVACATFLVGLLPSYHTLGFFSSIFFILLRVIQGICIGGEYTGVGVYIAESSTHSKRGFFTSFAASGANFGFLLAILIVAQLKIILPQSVLFDWGWRIPFILSGCFGLCILLWRSQLVETHRYLSLDRSQPSSIDCLQNSTSLAALGVDAVLESSCTPVYTAVLRSASPTNPPSVASFASNLMPFLETIQKSPTNLIKMIAITAMGSTFYMLFFGFLPNYLEVSNQLNLQNFWIQITGLSIMIFFIPIAGYLGDRLGRKFLLTLVVLGILFILLPGFYWLIHTQLPLAYGIVLSLAALISALEQGNTMTLLAESFGTKIRYSGVALSYNIGNALFGGTLPLIAAFFITQHHVFYVEIYLALISLVALFALVTNQASSESGTCDQLVCHS